MKILYYSDSYCHEVWGTKRSLYEEVQSRGIPIVWKHKSNLPSIVQDTKGQGFTQIWLAGSDIQIPFRVQQNIPIPFVAFGMSDPFMFDMDRLKACDVYITNHRHTQSKWRGAGLVPIIYNPPACDFRFHAPMEVPKKFDITVLGVGFHNRFSDPKHRIQLVDRLRRDGFNVWAFGNNWPDHPKNHRYVEGQEFLDVIRSSRIGLDIAEETFALSHRLFEYAACGVPSIAKGRPDVLDVFEQGTEIEVYNNYEDLKYCLVRLLEDERYATMGANALKRCQKEHNISHRVDHILSELRGLL